MTAPDDDGRVRCGWAVGRAGPDFLLYRDYHDHEWGQPLRGQVRLFERMTLEAFQSGLSWLIILRKRENFRKAFDGFDIEKVARYDDADVDRLLADESIVRNRAKIEATIANARAVADLDDLSELAVVVRAGGPTQARNTCRGPRHDAGIHRNGTRIEAPRIPLRRSDNRVRTDAGNRDGRRPPASLLGPSGPLTMRAVGGPRRGYLPAAERPGGESGNRAGASIETPMRRSCSPTGADKEQWSGECAVQCREWLAY